MTPPPNDQHVQGRAVREPGQLTRPACCVQRRIRTGGVVIMCEIKAHDDPDGQPLTDAVERLGTER